MVRLISIVLILIIFGGCTWIEREYYYKDNNNKADWHHQFIKGSGGGKRIQLPAKEVLIYTHDKFQLKLHISYLDMTMYGPVIIPIIPTPWDTDKVLSIEVEVLTGKEPIILDSLKWKIEDLSTNKIYFPNKLSGFRKEGKKYIAITSKNALKLHGHSYLFISYSIKVSDIDNIEINIGSFTYEKELIKPSPIKLKKTKGDWYWNGFTV